MFAQSGTANKTADAGSNVTSVNWSFSPSPGDAIAEEITLNLSQVLSDEYATGVYAVSGSEFTATATIKNSNTTLATIVIQVVVNRETVEGPVDLVDFTPPATLTAAQINEALGGSGAAEGSPLSGVSLTDATNFPAPSADEINYALVEAGSGALAGVSLKDTVLNEGEEITTDLVNGLTPSTVGVGDTIMSVIGYVSQS